MKSKVLKAKDVKKLDPGTKVTEYWKAGPSTFHKVWTVYMDGKHKKLYRDTGTMIMRQRIEDIEGHWYELHRH